MPAEVPQPDNIAGGVVQKYEINMKRERLRNSYDQYKYKELHTEVCKFTNVLETCGIKKCDVVTLYLPMMPEPVHRRNIRGHYFLHGA